MKAMNFVHGFHLVGIRTFAVMGNVRAKGRWWYWFCGIGHNHLGLVFEIETWVLGAHGCFRVRYSLHSTTSVKKKIEVRVICGWK